MKKLTMTACLAVVAATNVQADGHTTTSPETFAAQCVRETRSPGAYILNTSAGLPQVTAGDGATAHGARNVNDCLADKYQVQPGLVTVSVPGDDTFGRFDSRKCGEILSRSPGRAAGYAFGSAITFGAIGASVQAATYQRNLQLCMTLERQGALVSTKGLCARGEVLVRGNEYCGG